jgi:hypothetical protein
VVTTVAVSEAAGPDSLTALTEGFQSAFTAAIVFPVLGLICAIWLLRKARPPRAAEAEPSVRPDTRPRRLQWD